MHDAHWQVRGAIAEPVGSGIMARAVPDWDALQGALAGDVLLPGTPAYEAARRPANARFRHARPVAVVRCATPADVAATLAFARRSGLPTATRSGGHCFAGHSTTTGLVIDVRPMRAVAVAGDVATIGAGARLGEVYDALAAHGRALPAGCGPTVGIAGLALGGGLGVLGRKHGLTCDWLLGAEVVLADGRVVACDEHHDADLFWALRGAGGGNFGVVTSLAFRTLPAPTMTVFHLTWAQADAAAVIAAWQAWAPDAPDALAASLLLTAGGEVARPPALNLYGAMLGDEAEAATTLGELVDRAGADPATSRLARRSHREAKRYLAELGAAMVADHAGGASRDESMEEGLAHSKSAFFARPLPTGTIAALIAHFAGGRVPGQARELDFTPWGGAYNRARPDKCAFVHRAERFLLQHTVVVTPDAPATAAASARRWLADSWALAQPWASGGVYPNWPDPDLADPARAYYGPNLARLRRVKARYDPDNAFRHAQGFREDAEGAQGCGHLPPRHTMSRHAGSQAPIGGDRVACMSVKERKS